MGSTFIPESGGPENPSFIVMSYVALRETWISRLITESNRNIINAGGDPNSYSEREKGVMMQGFIDAATSKFPETRDYKVRAYEDDGLTPVAVFGDEATVIEEFEDPTPITCLNYNWDLRRVTPSSTVVTLDYSDCEGIPVTISDTAAVLGPLYNFSASASLLPTASDGGIVLLS
jgi:hypothetical protein